MSEQKYYGRVLGCNGGLYYVDSKDRIYECFAKGTFRYEKLTPLAGDRAEFVLEGDTGYITDILERKNELIRPPMANLDKLFVICAAKSPMPSTLNIDKLCAIAHNRGIEVVIVINKCELDPDTARELGDVYSKCGYKTVLLQDSPHDPETVKNKLLEETVGGVVAFAGASGVGKTTVINALYPDFLLQTGDISQKTGRGKHTTRQTRLFKIQGHDDAYIADTPGFSLLDFERFFFFRKEELPYSFCEFEKYLGSCKYVKCTHTKEEGCAVLEAVKKGEIPLSRHQSYLDLYESLKKQKEWELKKS
ncbi:MAG: ribosome small subunit-dependent GTPase A [Ruminococcaceae bacterium]|nr:ribosome small subunit-dependent GTPase A [Oscillospiraceae bacterium]